MPGLGQAEESAKAAQAAGAFQSVAVGEDGAGLPRYLHASLILIILFPFFQEVFSG